jgi:hypothetical protein
MLTDNSGKMVDILLLSESLEMKIEIKMLYSGKKFWDQSSYWITMMDILHEGWHAPKWFGEE